MLVATGKGFLDPDQDHKVHRRKRSDFLSQMDLEIDVGVSL
jgi:hypothetical protein